MLSRVSCCVCPLRGLSEHLDIGLHVQTLHCKRQTQRETWDHMMIYDVVV